MPRDAPLPWTYAFALILLGPRAAIEHRAAGGWSPLSAAAAILAGCWLGALGYQYARHPSPRPRRVWPAAGAGAVVGLATVYTLAAQRSDNGCTGVSSIYQWTLELTLIALFSLGPATLSRLMEV